MNYTDWQAGTAVASPVYVDANVLVAITVTKHRLYTNGVQLVGELLASQPRILISLMTVQESLWALARLSYYDLAPQRPGALFNRSIYDRWCGRIFASHGPRMAAISSMLHSWSQAGITVEVVPKTEEDFLSLCNVTPRYMRDYKLTPNDAAHLAIACAHARTFVTADSDFEQVARQSTSENLVIVHLAP